MPASMQWVRALFGGDGVEGDEADGVDGADEDDGDDGEKMVIVEETKTGEKEYTHHVGEAHFVDEEGPTTFEFDFMARADNGHIVLGDYTGTTTAPMRGRVFEKQEKVKIMSEYCKYFETVERELRSMECEYTVEKKVPVSEVEDDS